MKDRFYALKGLPTRRLKCYLCGGDHLLERCPTIPSGINGEEMRQLFQVSRDGNELRKAAVLSRIYNRLDQVAFAKSQHQEHEKRQPVKVSGWWGFFSLLNNLGTANH